MEWDDYDKFSFLELKNMGLYTFEDYLKDLSALVTEKELKNKNTYFKKCFEKNLTIKEIINGNK